MKIKLMDKVFTCDNRIPAVEETFNQINKLLADTRQVLNCLIIDNREIEEDYSQYIIDNLKEIDTIEIKVQSRQELIDDTLASIREYLERAVPEIDKLVDQFYQEVNQNTWQKFAQLMEGLQFIVDTLQVIDRNKDWYHNAVQFVQVSEKLRRQIVMLQEALESKDRVWLSDVLLYEITPSFQALNRAIAAITM